MKKTITLFMALALVTSLFAVPVSPKLQQQGKEHNATTVQQPKLIHNADIAAKHALAMNIARPQAHKAVAKKNISRNAVRKAPMDESVTSTYTFSSFTSSDKVELSSSNFNITLTKGTSNKPAYVSNQARIYPGGTLIISSTNNITKIEYSYEINESKSGKVPTIDGVTGSKADGTWDESTKTWTGSDTKVTFAISGEGGNVGFTSVTVTTDGQGGGGGGGEETEISGLTQAYAIYYEEEGYYYWDFDLAVEFNEESTTYPELYFMCDDEAESKTSIVGTYAAYSATVWKSAKDSVETDEDVPVGTMTITYVEEGVYNFEGSFEGTDGNTYTWSATNVEVIAYDADNEEYIELDEEGGGSTVDTIVVSVNYVDAVRYDEYSSAGAYIWQIDAMNYTSQTQYEDLWFMVTTVQDNRLEGLYDIESGNIYNYWGYYYAGYTKVNGTDTTSVSAGSENIQLMVAYDETSKAYDLVGELLSEDGKKLYQFEVENFSIVAFNEEEKDIVLMDSVEFVPDTFDITGQDAIEIAYYASYSEEGSYYNYSANLYSVANDYPYLMFDIYTFTKDEFVGSYDTATNVGAYCNYYADEDTQIGVVNPVFTISKNGDIYTITGSFTGADQNIYRFSVSAEATMADGDHPYEPMDKQEDINIVANSKTLDTQYVSDYGELDLYLNGTTDTIQLALVTSKTTIANGTYAISTAEEPADGELIAGDYSYLGIGGCAAYVGNDVYYLTAGSLVVATANDTVTYTLNATSSHGTVVTAMYKEYKAGPTPGEHTIVIADYKTVKFTTTDGKYQVSAHGKGTAPSYNTTSLDLRVYAKDSLEITSTTGNMTQLVFNLSEKGQERQADLTVNTGVMSYDAANGTVTWTGNADYVYFIVGDKNVYGTKNKGNEGGQFDFTSIDITLSDPTGLMETSSFKIQNSKFILKGQLLILKDGVLYNAQGQVVK